MILRFLKCFFCQNNDLQIIIPDEKYMQYTIVNFSKCNVPFRHTVLIKPIHDHDNRIAFLMGISHFDFNLPPLHINPQSLDYISLIQELDHLPFSIVLTTSYSPFLIKFANKQWLAQCGYELSDVLHKTFSVIQGKEIENNHTALQFKNKVTASLNIWKRHLIFGS